MKTLEGKAGVLIEALPYIKRFSGKTVVIKYGGHAMAADGSRDPVIDDMILMKFVGLNPVIVHGGGPEITAMLGRIGKQSEFVAGLRVTDRETAEIAEMVLAGKIGRRVVAALNLAGGKAVGLTGKDGALIKASKKLARDKETGQPIDIGFVGQVDSINPEILELLIGAGYIPVISPIGIDDNGETYNINADTVAGAIAGALKAEKFVLLTDVEGIFEDYHDKGTLIPTLPLNRVQELIRSGKIDGGMIPKVEACATAIRGGAAKAHILDGRRPHALLLEIFTDRGVGTMVVSQ